MSPRTVLAILRAALRQAAADLRPVIAGAGAFSVLACVAGFVAVGRFYQGVVGASTAFGAMLAASAVGAMGSFIVLQIASEAYTDRIGGALLRVRILPHGPLTWMLGKLLSSVAHSILIQGSILVGAALLIDSLPLSASQALACLPLIVLTAVASAPLGFLAGAASRGMYSALCSYLVILVVVGTSGFLYPLPAMPGWVQAIHQVLPAYWSGHLSRWALVGDPSWEVGGAFHPVLAIGVLLAWIIGGLACAPLIVRHSFRRETIGSLARVQSVIRSQTGL